MENTARNVGCEWLRSKQEEHIIIADLTGFDNLKAMLGAEDNTRRRKGTLKTKEEEELRYFQFQAQEHMPVNVAKAKGQEATVVEGEKALTVDCKVNSAGLAISCSGTAEMVQVECSATKETEQKRIEKENVDTMVEMTQASATTNGVNSSIAIGVSLSSLEGNISFCRGVAETVPADTFMVNAMEQKRKVHRASKEMQEDTAKGMEREQVEFTDNIVLRQLLVNVAKAKGQEATVVEGEKALTVDCKVNSAGLAISCSGTAEMVQVECSATKETEQKRIEKENVDTMVEMTQASATTNGVNSSIAIGVSLSSLEGNISFCRGVAETVPADTFMVNAMEQKRKVNVI
ncbi:hypothetical protein NC651_035234 [Populus alba x Populus x berolinensis]|nr:hypothetical protein NC651_035234 [Populus alba x Populus x berolinensis]